MKKRLLAITLAFASVAFAQQATQTKVSTFKAKTLGNEKIDGSKIKRMKTAQINSNWFSYVNAYETFYGQQLASLNANLLFPDSTILVNYGGGTYAGPWIHSLGVVMDLQASPFKDLATPANNFYPGVAYTIDSLVTTGIYTRVSGSSVVDTLVIRIYESGANNLSTVSYFYNNGVTTNLGSDTVFLVNFDWDFATLKGKGITKEIRVLMDDNFFTDTTASGLHQVDVAVNQNMAAMNNRFSGVFGVSYDFRPGYTWAANIDTLGVDQNAWRFLSWELNGDDTYPYYDKNDFNTSNLVPFAVRYDMAGGWNSTYIPSYAYMGATAGFSYEAHETNVLITQDVNISVKENTKIDFSVYPNPSNGEFNVRFGNVANGTYTVRLVNIIGQEMYNNTVEVSANQVETFNFNNVEKGVYLLSISGNGMNTVQRVILK